MPNNHLKPMLILINDAENKTKCKYQNYIGKYTNKVSLLNIEKRTYTPQYVLLNIYSLCSV